MERGVIKSYSQGGSGTLVSSGNAEIFFNFSSIIGKDKDLKNGDHVWFEMESIACQHVAINIRKCM